MTVVTSGPKRARRSLGVVDTLTGVAAAFGLSASGTVIGAMLARLLDTLEVLPDHWAPAAWIVFAMLGTIAAGATVAEVAGLRAWLAIGIAGVLAAGGLWEIMQSVETTGAEGVELPVVLVFGAGFIALLAAGAWLRGRGARTLS
jgi:hypothetical protein